jgi:2-polyprenyl-3-methyl-5-hydroxy-6-metoxy-1,4-benzoquinol methylase
MFILTHKEFNPAFDRLLETYPSKAISSIVKDKAKYFAELAVAVDVLNGLPGVVSSRFKLLDVGGGSGNFAWLAKDLFDLDVFMVDRQTEFAPELGRVMGDSDGVSQRMSKKEITFTGVDPVSEEFFMDENFDVIVNFDVIEHLSFGVPLFVEKLSKQLTVTGCLVISTPNQVHLVNRIKSLLGYNTWEDYDYYMSCDHFFGHIRELTLSEFRVLLSSTCSHGRVFGRSHQLNRYGTLGRKKFFPLVVGRLFDSLFPFFSYQLFSISKRKQ